MIFTYYANVQKPLLSPSLSLSPPSSLISFSFRPIAYNRVKRHGVYKSFSCRVRFLRRRRRSSVPSFPSTKTSHLHFFSCREIENPRIGGENERGRKIDDEARANVTRSSRFLRRSLNWRLNSRVINAARTSILISKLTKLEIRGGTRQFFRNAGTRSRATGVLLFAVAGLKQRKKGNASRERRRERSMQSGPTSSRVRSPAA